MVLGPWSVRSGLAGRVAADMSSAARVRGVVLVPKSKPRRQHEVSGVILARLHAALQATSDTWQRCRAPRAAHRPRQTTSGSPVWLLSGGSRGSERRGGWKPGNMFGQGGSKKKKTPKSLVRFSTRIEVVLTSLGRHLSVAACAAGNQSEVANAVSSRTRCTVS